MSDYSQNKSIGAIPKQLALGTLLTLGAIVVTASVLMKLLPMPHEASPAIRVAPLPERIAPVARVELATSAATASPSAPAAPAPAAATPPAPSAAALAPSATSAAAAPAAASAAPAAAPSVEAKTSPVAGRTGEQIYQATCVTCHAAGVAGAPKLGDRAAWGPRLATGMPALVKNALNGKGAMPPKGGNASLSEAEIQRAVVYMANQAGASFKEPAAAAPVPASPAVAATPVKPAEKPATSPATAPAAATAAPVRSQPPVAAAVEPAAARPDGKAVYQKTCSACHAAGVAGAPKLGDIAAWGPRIASGADALLNSVLKGKNAMPPRGGNPKLSDAEVRAALEYMLGQFK